MLNFFVSCRVSFFFFFFNDTATTEIYTLSLHDALPIYGEDHLGLHHRVVAEVEERRLVIAQPDRVSGVLAPVRDRKSTRLNSSHSQISYAVFCLKKKQYDDSKSRDISLLFQRIIVTHSL